VILIYNVIDNLETKKIKRTKIIKFFFKIKDFCNLVAEYLRTISMLMARDRRTIETYGIVKSNLVCIFYAEIDS